MSKINLSGHHWNGLGGKGFKGFMHISIFEKMTTWGVSIEIWSWKVIILILYHVKTFSCIELSLFAFWFQHGVRYPVFSRMSEIFRLKLDSGKLINQKFVDWKCCFAADFPENLSEGPFCFKEMTWALQSATNAIYVSRHRLALFTFMNYDK